MSKAATDTLDKVSGEFESEVVTELESSRSETLAKIESVRKETADAVAKILETGSRQAESVKRQIIGAAELEARNSELKSLEKAVGEVFDLAAKEVSSKSGAAHEKALAGLIQGVWTSSGCTLASSAQSRTGRRSPRRSRHSDRKERSPWTKTP